jgi:hypothetical protein
MLLHARILHTGILHAFTLLRAGILLVTTVVRIIASEDGGVALGSGGRGRGG